jgi:hypothetical protein
MPRGLHFSSPHMLSLLLSLLLFTGMKSVYNLLWDSSGPKLADKIRASVPYTSDTSPGCKNFSDADLIQILGEFIKL